MTRWTTLLLTVIFLAVGTRGTASVYTGIDRVLSAQEKAQGYLNGRILVKPKDSIGDATREEMEGRLGVTGRTRFQHLKGHQLLEISESKSVRETIAQLKATGMYEFVEPDRIVHVLKVPNDPSFGVQWSLKNTGQNGGLAGADINASAGWDVRTDASSVVVGVLDSGLRLTHADLAGNLWTNSSPGSGVYRNDLHGINATVPSSSASSGNPNDTSTAGHGTHVAGIIGAVGNNGVGISGVAWQVKLMGLKFITDDGTGSSSAEIACIDYAIAHGVKVLNASFGSDQYSAAEYNAIKQAGQAGIIFVAAAGNDTINVDTGASYPAGYLLDNIVTVAATTNLDQLASFSDYGSGLVDLGAPGDVIRSTFNTSDTAYADMSGTSMAAPHVTGALALLKAQFPSDTYRQTINRLLRSVSKLSSLSGYVQSGGSLNLGAALTSTDNRPFNDDFASAAVLRGPNVQVRSSNAGATAEAGEPSRAGVSPSHSLWWTWTASDNASVVFDTSGSGYDTVLGVYTGDALSSLSEVASNDDASGATTSRVKLNTTAGTTYHIVVDGKNGATGLTVLKIGTVPANDDFANALTVSGASAKANGTTLNATSETGEPVTAAVGAGHTVWYSWVAPTTGQFQVAAFSTTADMVAAVYTGSAVNGLAQVAANDNSSTTNSDALVTFTATAGMKYMIAVDDTGGSSGDFILTINDTVWQYPTDDKITSSPAAASDGTVYFGSNDNYVYALTSSGTLKWKTATGDTIDGASPAVGPDGTVYIGSNDSSVYALDAATGATKWKFAATSSISSTPAVGADGTVYVRDDTTLYALNASTGSAKWSFPLSGGTYSSPSVAADGTVYVGATGGTFYAVGADGTKKWTFTADNDIYTSPVIAADGTVYFATLSGSLYAVSSAGAQKWVWHTADGSSLTSSPALGSDGTLYLAGYDHKLHAISSAGTEKWSFTATNEVRASSPAVAADGTIYFADYDGKIYAVNGSGAQIRYYTTAQLIRSSPVLSGTRLFIGSEDAKLYAINTGQTAVSSAWPMFHENALHTGRVGTSTSLSFSVMPQSQTVALGSTLTLTAQASDSAATYQWYFNGAAIGGATGSTLTIPNVTAANAGSYAVVVTSGSASVTSTAAVITVADASSRGRLVNISARAVAGAGDQTLTIGFVVSGSGNKPLLVRGIGPALANYGVQGYLADPVLSVLKSQTVLASNDNWGGDAGLSATTAAAGAFALPASSLDAATVVTLAPDAYTAQITGKSGATGVALGEVYDASTSFTADTPQIVNLSARTQIGTGGNILIAGFVIGGSTSRTVLIRAVGPTLAQFSVSGVLADPQLALYSSDNTLLKQNDDWGSSSDSAAIVTTTAQVNAFSLPAGSKDAVILSTLAPGAYTAQVKGANDTTGVALVELYLVP